MFYDFFLFSDACTFTVRDCYKGKFWQIIKLSVSNRLSDIESNFCRGAFDSFKDEFMNQVEFWCRDIFYTVLDKHNMDYTHISYYLKENQELLNFNDVLWDEMCSEYEMIIPFMENLVESFTNHICEIAESLHKNSHKISENFLHGERVKVSCIEKGISDYHDDFRSVHIINYENGCKIVFKPRSLKTDIAWRNFMNEICQMSSVDLFLPKSIDFENHGYQEYVKDLPVYSEEDLKKFFFNAGFISVFIFALNGSDFHAENMIAHGVSPVLVDVETVIGIYDSSLKPNILRSCFYPNIQRAKSFQTSFDALTKIFNNSVNLPLYLNKRVTGREYAEDIKNGFKHGYNLLLHLKKQNKMENLIVSHFKGCEIRQVIKQTSYYSKVLFLLRKKQFMKSKDVFYGKLNGLPLLDDYEKKCISKFQIPKFTTTFDDSTLTMQTISYMNEIDLLYQCGRIDVLLSNTTANLCRETEKICIRNKTSTSKIKKHIKNKLGFWNEKIIKFLNKETSLPCTVVVKDELHYYFASGNLFFPESIAGIMLVNACYFKLYADKDIEKILLLYVKQLKTDLENISPKALDLCFLEGFSGLLRVLSMIWKLTEINYYFDLCNYMVSFINELKFPFFKSKDWLYGELGLLTAIAMLPSELQNDNLPVYFRRICNDYKVSDFPEALYEINQNNRFYLLDNDNYRFGNAATVNLLIDEYLAHRDESALNHAKSIADKIFSYADLNGEYRFNIISEYPFISFFYGEGGVLYTLLRCISPHNIPKLYDADLISDYFSKAIIYNVKSKIPEERS